MKHAWTNLLLPTFSSAWTGLRLVGPKALSNNSSVGSGSSELNLADCLLKRLLEHQNK